MEDLSELNALESTTKPPLPVPELQLHPTAPQLSETQRNILEKQWQNFWSARREPQAMNPFTGTLEEGWLIHQTKYEPDKVDSILETGILSGETGFEGKVPIPEDGETHFCADFFINQEERDIKSYTEYAKTPIKSPGGLKTGRMEQYSVPANNNNISFIIDPHKLPQEILHYSATGLDKDLGALKDWPIQFPKEGESAARHLAVLTGVPANYTNCIVVGEQLAEDTKNISHLKNSLFNSKLSIPIYTSAGKRIA